MSVVRELQGPEAPPDVVHRYGALVFHAFHFLEAGCPVFLLTAAVARYLVEAAPAGEPEPPAPSGYLQLPQHLFWSRAAEDGPPESVDGMFWCVSRRGLLHILVVTGMRGERPGFGAVPLPEAPLSDAGAWLQAEVREGGEDYRSSLPGRELDRLYSVETAGELLKLLARFFAYVHAAPRSREAPRQGPEATRETQGEVEPPPGDAGGRAGAGPRPSQLAFTRVVLAR